MTRGEEIIRSIMIWALIISMGLIPVCFLTCAIFGPIGYISEDCVFYLIMIGSCPCVIVLFLDIIIDIILRNLW